ncbi:MAG: hypothetical protein HC906_04155 [Bacteroidales bacterium]|nr:hypothetical protein [Bacteroidales bacterium]
MLKKSDVIILDWQMHYDSGKKATDLVLSVLKESIKPELRLIIIYTDDPTFNIILDNNIIPEVRSAGIHEEIIIDESGCSLILGQTKILVFNKENGERTEYTVNDNELPERVIMEFTKITDGLVSNAALKAVTVTRRNSHHLLGLFNKYLDSAYLTHRALLPIPDDAEMLIKDSIVNIIDSIISNSNIGRECNFEKI